MLAVIIFIIIIGVLIFVHELGHFLVARRNGISAPEFGFGFPPRIFGIQSLSGKKMQKVKEVESIETQITDVKVGEEEIIQETITEKIHSVDEMVPTKKWRIIWGNRDGDDENEKRDRQDAHENRMEAGTVYSLNWIPLGGFVRIKGEDGGNRDDEDSFANKSAWTRTKVLAAGVIMNFLFAWLVISIGLMIGAPEAVDIGTNVNNSKIQISQISSGSPAEIMGLKVGDEISKTQIGASGQNITLPNIEGVQNYINSQKGQQINLRVLRGKQVLDLKGTPRVNTPEGQGPLGIALMQTVTKSYPWYQAIWNGLIYTVNMIGAILVAFWGLLRGLFMGHGVSADISGPVGIAVLTKDVTNLGFVYILQFAAIISINLGIINALPIPALDGGRILFILIEKIRRRPVSQQTEQVFHTVFFVLLILLMVVVTFRDVGKLIMK